MLVKSLISAFQKTTLSWSLSIFVSMAWISYHQVRFTPFASPGKFIMWCIDVRSEAFPDYNLFGYDTCCLGFARSICLMVSKIQFVYHRKVVVSGEFQDPDASLTRFLFAIGSIWTTLVFSYLHSNFSFLVPLHKYVISSYLFDKWLKLPLLYCCGQLKGQTLELLWYLRELTSIGWWEVCWILDGITLQLLPWTRASTPSSYHICH